MTRSQEPGFDDLRTVSAAQLRRYRAQHDDLLGFITAVHGCEPVMVPADAEIAVYHASRSGFAGASKADGERLVELAGGHHEGGAVSGALLAELTARGWTQPGELDLGGLVQKTLDTFPAIQNPLELRGFLEVVVGRAPQVVVEIGTAAGGVLYCLSQIVGRGGLLVSIDVPYGGEGGGPACTDDVVASFAPHGQRLELVRDRSFHHSTKLDLLRVLDGRAIDLLFIDGDHSYAGVKSDFEMYGALVRPGGLIALHDICMTPATWGRGNDVGVFWNELRGERPTREIIDPNGVRKAPRFDTPVGFEMPALGFGLVPVAA